MKILVTGASGFLGRHVVLEAVRAGHSVRAVIRPQTEAAALPWSGLPGVEVARVDLRTQRGLDEALAGIDAVIHTAADKTGDLYAQLAGTVVATENLLQAMVRAGVSRLVAVSSLAVYEYLRRFSFAKLVETSPLAADLAERDDYTRTKTLQEQLVREYAEKHRWRCTIVRPGVIYGKDNTWCARLGFRVKDGLWIRTGAWARLPLTHVESCAEALVLCAAREEAAGRTFNVIDDDAPTQRAYLRELRRRMSPAPRVLPVPWTAMRAVARLAWLVNKLVFRGRARLPSILVPARLHARCKPLRYDNRLLKQTLGWRPRYSLEEALDRCLGRPKEAGAA